MMVTFVSQCEKNALKKTRRVLDAFADRIGDNTWQTLITEDGLQTVKKMLRQTASKSTAVSCHWIRSRSRSQFLWVVGNKAKFDARGVVPVNRTEKNQNVTEQFSLNTDVIALLAQIAGLFHDVGKAMSLFQDKLEPDFMGKGYEPYRHEWVSLRIFQAFVNKRNDKSWLEELANIDNQSEATMLANLENLKDGITPKPDKPFIDLAPVAKLVAWLIVSHHKLPQYPKEMDNPPALGNIDSWLNNSFEACWNTPQCLKSDWLKSNLINNWSFPFGTPLKSAFWQTHARMVANKLLKCERIFLQSWFSQRYTAHLSRLSLMLADHYYSSKKEATLEWQDGNYHAYANTDRDEEGNKYKKQKLDEHNIGVAQNAYDIAKALPHLKIDLPALKPNKAFTEKVPKAFNADFGWQDNAFNLACAIKDNTKKYGFFGVCMSSTGKGKTRGNARIMYGLSDEGQCRFNVALGLRTLTLQTGDALKENLKLNSDELSLLIGSQAVKDLHQQKFTDEQSDKQQLGSESAELLLKDQMSLIEDLPEYTGCLSKWLKHDEKILKLIQSPVLVSTIDYLMPANEGVRGGRQIAPMLRLLTSDLVLDEPDDFGIADLPALCRLVNWAGMLGSRVLLSTATISPALANSLFLAYQSGRKQFTQVNGELGETADICCAWFDEFKKPHSELIPSGDAYHFVHNHFVDKRINYLAKNSAVLRKAKLIELLPDRDKRPSELFASTIRQSIENLHQRHKVTVDSKQVSIGLVRMANIDPLVHISKCLISLPASNDTVIHYCIYHSQFPLLQRSKIENQLDSALSRNDEKEWLLKSGIVETIKSDSAKNHIFVVLATAVAEVGRDHDYDWAIVEPSSMRSIIQLAGRVQRHRKQVPTCDNIHILSKNFKGLMGKQPSYEKPGFETEKLSYASVDLKELTGVNEFDEINAIARIKSPSTLSLTQGRFNSFNELEHLAQSLRLQGSKKEHNHAAQWWKNDVTWCAELQRLQPFRQSTKNDDFNLNFTRTGKVIWQKKIANTSPAQYENTLDISAQVEPITLASGNTFWSKFDLKVEVKKLIEKTKSNEEYTMKKFTHLSLRQLKENSAEQWQNHPILGVYKILKKDEYR